MAIKFLNNSEVTGTLSVSSISNDNATYTGIVDGMVQLLNIEQKHKLSQI